MDPLNIQPIVVLRGLKRHQADALTNFVGCFLLALSFPFYLLLLSALNDLTGPSAGPLAQIPYSFIHFIQCNLKVSENGGGKRRFDGQLFKNAPS